jgi:hypothetical protein
MTGATGNTGGSPTGPTGATGATGPTGPAGGSPSITSLLVTGATGVTAMSVSTPGLGSDPALILARADVVATPTDSQVTCQLGTGPTGATAPNGTVIATRTVTPLIASPIGPSGPSGPTGSAQVMVEGVGSGQVTFSCSGQASITKIQMLLTVPVASN